MIHLDEKFILHNISGNIVTFETNTESPLGRLETEIKGRQNLHGYDAPWSGGCGKNLLPFDGESKTDSGITFTVGSNGQVTITGTNTSSSTVWLTYLSSGASPAYEAGTYTLNGIPGGASSSTYRLRYRKVTDGAAGDWTYVTRNGDTEVSIAEGQRLNVHIGIGPNYAIPSSVVFSPMLRRSTETDPNFAPYANICPISGWTGCNIIRTGRNLLTEPGAAWRNRTGEKYTDSHSVSSCDLIPTFPGDKFIYFRDQQTPENASLVMRVYDKNKNYIKNGPSMLCTEEGPWGVYVPSDGYYVTFTQFQYDGVPDLQVQVEHWDDFTGYEGPTMQSFQIPFPSEAGTCYGGYMDVTTGLLTVTHGQIASYNGETLPAKWISDRDVYVEGEPPTIGAQVVYELAVPIDYWAIRTPITTIDGINNIWADTGDIRACEYQVSFGDPYENHFAAIENGSQQHIRVTFIQDNMVFEDKDFTDRIRITSYMNPDIDLTFGTAYASEVSLQFLRSQKTEQLNWTREFSVEFGVEQESGTDWVQVGIFSGKRPKSTSNGVIDLTGYDRMQRFDRDADDFLDLMTFPCTLQELFDELCSFVMVSTVEGDEIAEVMARTVTEFDRNGINSCRDLLSMIAEANGCYARITPEGLLQFQWFQNHRNDYSLKRDLIFSFERTNLQQFDGKTWGYLRSYTWRQLRYLKWKEMYNRVKPFYISRILAKWAANGDNEKEEVMQPPEGVTPEPMTWDDADQLTWDEFDQYTWDEVEGAEIDGAIYTIEGNPFLHYDTEQEIRNHLQLLVNRVKRFFMYHVAAVSAVGDWIIEAGDVISLEMEDGTEAVYPIFSRTLDWNGFCECEYESTGNIIRGES